MKDQFPVFQASTSASLENCIIKLASWVSGCAMTYLSNNKFSFKRVSDLREKESSKYQLEIELMDIRRKARLAWKNKDYSRVVDLYGPVKHSIEDSERKRLEFAIKNKEIIVNLFFCKYVEEMSCPMRKLISGKGLYNSVKLENSYGNMAI